VRPRRQGPALLCGPSTSPLDVAPTAGSPMLLYYYLRVPELPAEVAHQSGSVQVLEYLVEEGQQIGSGTPLVRVENWWARMEFDSEGAGVFAKAFFPKALFGDRTPVLIGDPFAIMVCEPEARPHASAGCSLRVVETLRAKPDRGAPSNNRWRGS